MPRIPLQSLVSPRQNGMQIQPGAFQQTAQATANLLSSVDGASKEIKAQFDRAQDLQNQNDLSTERRTLRDAQGTFQNEMAQNDIPAAQWGDEWQKVLTGIEGGIKKKDFPPVVMRALDNDFKNFASSSFIQISGAALKAVQREARQGLDMDMDFADQTGDFSAGQGALDAAHENKVISDKEYEHQSRMWDFKKDAAGRKETLQLNPALYVENLKKGKYGLKEVQNAEEIKKGEYQLLQYGINDLESITMDVESEFPIIGNEEDLVQALDKLEFATDDMKAKYLKNWKLDKPIEGAERVFFLSRMRNNMKRLERGDQVGYAEEYDQIKRVLSQRGKHGNEMNQVLWNDYRPSYLFKKVEKKSDSERQNILNGVENVGADMVEAKVKGWAAIATEKLNKPSTGLTTSKSQRVEYARQKAAIVMQEIKVEEAMQRSVNEFISSFVGTPLSSDVEKHLNDNYLDIVESTLGVGETVSGGGVVEDAQTSEQRLNSILPPRMEWIPFKNK